MKLSTKIDRILIKQEIVEAAFDYAHRFAQNPSSDIDDNYDTLSKKLNEILKIKLEA